MTGEFWAGETTARSRTKPNDATNPASAPTSATTILSTRICRKMASPVAPIALQMPISRMRSLMLASMMFMMPMPPTIRLIAAMMPPLRRALRICESMLWIWFSCVRRLKSSMPR